MVKRIDPRVTKTRIDVKVTPRASTDEIVGWTGDVLRMRVHEVPERGKANASVETLLANALGVSVGSVQVVSGHRASRKIVEIVGLDADEVRRRLSTSNDGA